MKCIIVDDEPLARKGMEILLHKNMGLDLIGSFSNTKAAGSFLTNNTVDIIFLDIEMPGMNGVDFAKTIAERTLVIFTTAYAEYALNSYEVEAIDYLIKPIEFERFQKAISKASSYLDLLKRDHAKIEVGNVSDDYFFIKLDRKFVKIKFKDILFIEGLKDYAVIQTEVQKIMASMNVKTIYDQLPQQLFIRISKSYIVNVQQIESFDNNTVFIRKHEIPVGNTYRNYFFEEFVKKKILSR